MIQYIKTFAYISSFFFLFNSCSETQAPEPSPKIITSGVLDLTGIPLDNLSPFPLRGEWDAFPGELPVLASDFLALEEKKPSPLYIPGYWIDQNLPAHGFVTYRLKLQVDNPGSLMLYLREASSAYKVFVWSPEKGLVLLGLAGRLSRTKENSIGYYTETAKSFRVSKGSILFLQVSNFLYSRGGAYYSPMLGGTDKTIEFLRNKDRKKMFFIGVFSLLFFYHLILFLHRRKDHFTLFYAFVCMSLLVRMLLFERLTRSWFVPSDFMEMLQIRMEYIAFVCVQLFSLLFFYYFFMPLISKKKRTLMFLPPLFLLLSTLTLPYSLYTKLLQVMQLHMVAILIYACYAVSSYVKRKETRYTGIVFLLGAFVILSTTVFDSIVFLMRWDLPFLTDYGFTFYSICLAIIISHRNSRAWETAEYLTFNLQSEVEQKIAELRREKERAERANDLKDKFISIVSHDIRSPLFGISSVLSLLTESPPSLTPEGAKQVLGDASSGLKNLLSMVEGLLNYSRFQNATLFPDFQLFDFSPILANLSERATPLLAAKRIRLSIEADESSVGIGDPHLIEHLIWNLMTNAIKFTPMDKAILISLKEESGAWCLQITDQGIGFPKSWVNSIFDEGFQYLRKGTIGEMGAGIGLAFCKEVSDRHGATLIANSTEGEGAVFEFRLPNFDKVVMVLDDNPGYRKQLRKIIKNIPCILWEEEDPIQAMDAILKLKPDLILVDFSMPEKNGITFLSELYKNPDLLDIRTILLSSESIDPNTGNRLDLEVTRVGGDCFIKKSANDQKIISEILRLLKLN
jgi:signal transduction histidine kinase